MIKSYDHFNGIHRFEKVGTSPIRAVLDKATAMKAQGLPVIPFSVGEPDFNTPTDIKEYTMQAIQENYSHYGSNWGYPELRQKLAVYTKEQTGMDYDPKTEFLVTCGGAEALNNVIMTFVEKGDEVIIPTPAFVSYKCIVNMCGGTFVDVPLLAKNQFQIPVADVAAKVTPRTKMLVLNNPNNPSGAVYSKETLSGLCRLAVEHNFLILADEMYARLTYNGASFYSIASFPGMRERAVVVTGFSKTFAMTGWRLGYVYSDARLMKQVHKTHQYSTTCAPTFIQAGACKGMDTPRTKREVVNMVEAFARRRNLITTGLKAITNLSVCEPFGAFYILVDVSATGMNGADFAAALLEQKYVATVPAVGLGSGCSDFIRISYATSDENIVEGVKRIGEFVSTLKR